MKYWMYLCFVATMFFTGCSDDDDQDVVPVITPEAEGTWTDPRDGSTYNWVRYGNLEWLCENMRILPFAGDYWLADQIEEGSEEFMKYGYLYTFAAAQSLPADGWRLPSDEDWKNLEMCMGMSEMEADQTGWRGQYVGTLLMQDAAGTGVGLLCGGYAHNLGGMGSRRLFVDGIYWSSTEDESSVGYSWCRMITYNKEQVRRESMTQDRYMSVRLVRDVQP